MKSPINWGAIIAVVVVGGLLALMFSSMDRSKVEVFGVRGGEATVRPAVDPLSIGVQALHANDHNHDADVDHDAFHKERQESLEKALFTTPGGKYTAEDIKANGPKFPGELYAFIPQRMDLAPTPGKPICPVTLTRANPSIKWQIGGKTYTFSSSLCIEEFVIWAKELPNKVKDPADYVAPPASESGAKG